MTKIKSKKVKARPKIKSNKLEDFKPEYVQFNFSFITKHEKYNLENNDSIHTLLLEKIYYLSSMDWVQVLALRKEQGIETLSSHALKKFTIPPEFKDRRDDYCTDKFFVFRLRNQGRVIGKMIDKTFYILAIDTTFDLYKH